MAPRRASIVLHDRLSPASRIRAGRRRPGLIAGVLMLVLLGSALTARPQAATLWGATGTYSNNLGNFKKWRGEMDRYRNELQTCGMPQCNKPKWAQIIGALKGLDPAGQAMEIQKQLGTDRFRYTQDIINWRLNDYWETPFEFIRVNGDCEDYAVSKYWALRAAGVPADSLQIVVLQDLNLGVAHAVLVVDLQGQQLLLDNQISKVVQTGTIQHYQPVYSVNEDGWWQYRK
jgi:predicted transglutaminase-like cysteine proteinase